MKIKFVFGVTTTLVLIVGAIFLFDHVYKVKEIAQISEMKTAMAALISSMKAFHNETGRYSDDFDAIGYFPEGTLRSKLFLKSKDVPQDILERIAEEDRPFVSDSDYQILGILELGDREIVIKANNRNSEPQQITLSESD